MNYEEFCNHVKTNCMYETVYDDTEGRQILVIRMLDAYVVMQRLVEAEREACAVIAETPVSGEQDGITMEAKDRVAAAIRARGQI